ncbi:NAD(P)-dependent oxidoreductase [Streptomyces humi]|uniref:NAD(P)-dependent oxidoreductase n=1 Tax=Streptomyces humi TaxID=1428620 RepID=UPI0009A0B1D6|nr:NAD(P)-dependent oxidoreductase [Streptomyces humi]
MKKTKEAEEVEEAEEAEEVDALRTARGIRRKALGAGGVSGGSVGFVGLGNMGSVLAGNLVAAGHMVVTHDALGPRRSPAGAVHVASVAEVAGRTDVLVLSLPDGPACEQVAREILAVPERRVRCVVDTSTVGPAAARAVAALLAGGGVGYVDAPVSGGVAGARARTLTVMYAGADEACACAEGVLAGLSDRRRRVGDRPGPAQALKLANNFLAATALAATSEAVAFGVAAGLEMATMLDVLNESSGQSAASRDKFPAQVLTGRYAAGFTNSLMDKDVRLYLRAVGEQGGAAAIAQVTGNVWERFARAEPGADFTRIFPFTDGS